MREAAVLEDEGVGMGRVQEQAVCACDVIGHAVGGRDPREFFPLAREMLMFIERHAEGNYKTKHAKTARFYYSTIHIHVHRYTDTCAYTNTDM